jgi:hypothetical protein
LVFRSPVLFSLLGGVPPVRDGSPMNVRQVGQAVILIYISFDFLMIGKIEGKSNFEAAFKLHPPGIAWDNLG